MCYLICMNSDTTKGENTMKKATIVSANVAKNSDGFYDILDMIDNVSYNPGIYFIEAVKLAGKYRKATGPIGVARSELNVVLNELF